VAAVATLCSALLGFGAAVAFMRLATRRQNGFRLAMLSPLLLPEILTSIAILIAINAVGWQPSYVSLQAGHILITMPYVFMNVVASLQRADPSLPLAASGLGASEWKVLLRVTIPSAKPGLISGCLFAFVISFDLFNLSLLLRGIGGITLPLALSDYMNWNLDPAAAAVSGTSVCLSILAVIIIDRFVGLRSLRF
jgi:putative spermidine/putrescine transport system permease protein